MPKLYIMTGLQASGKSTKAKEILERHGSNNCVIANKDGLRQTLLNGEWTRENEKFTLAIHDEIIRQALKSGKHAISDNTNLGNHIDRLTAIAKTCLAEVEVVDFTHVTVDECIKRDQKRQNYVGEKVIRDTYKRYLQPKSESRPISRNPKLPDCIICDLDGTVAIKGDRSPFDWKRVGEDKPRWTVIEAVNGLQGRTGAEVIFFSGRDAVCFDETLDWLRKVAGFPAKWNLYMRPEGDNRKDYIIKTELYEKYIKHRFNVTAIFDDRQQVIRECWRKLGLGDALFDVGTGEEF